MAPPSRLRSASLRRGGPLACALAALLVAAGCGGGLTGPAAESPRDRAAPAPPASSCPPALAGCVTASGRVLYVEAVDPDGDGDAHLVLASRASVTAPGITVVDVAPRLRPEPLPRPGDRVSAAGPVYRGSYRQRQIEAVELQLARR